MNIDIGILLILLAFVAGFLVGGKWKVRLFRKAMDFEIGAKAKLDAIRKKL